MGTIAPHIIDAASSASGPSPCRGAFAQENCLSNFLVTPFTPKMRIVRPFPIDNSGPIRYHNAVFFRWPRWATDIKLLIFDKKGERAW